MLGTSGLLARYPKLRLELVMDDGFSNIVADGVDAGIRLGESLDEHMVAVPTRRRWKWPSWARLPISSGTAYRRRLPT